MRFLLDTHVLLWYLLGDPQLSAKAKKIVDAGNNLHFSVASLWEISIKINIGKLQINHPFHELAEQLDLNNIELLSISFDDLKTYVELPLMEHRDPFDRILAAQALTSSLTLISRDPKLDLYSVQRLWS
ncbi:type II toxin-antitoxin system VapC family toxin [Leptolyngbya boryana CZ1]|uniref:Type II toxin-antitoxin system VapC family toxin n=1 Tax=Leptolyngbya boryana CZ1 TaxID=3060204 RepID=A0AA97AQP6_LEPBY|nr:type II toxin-antitoxin system VapC family toxin [Leptolyngbya boryana]WNZ43570.1 type II toxin-antitoxin system VapC family toxin [Leptolyngbya boryana CZ1]